VCGIECVAWFDTLVQKHRKEDYRAIAADQQHIIDFANGHHVRQKHLLPSIGWSSDEWKAALQNAWNTWTDQFAGQTDWASIQ
ncbi:unnamed protein product, partial [Symbiodinium sp. CCMP2592]